MLDAYAERDAEVTLLVLWQEMKKEIISQDLEDIFDLRNRICFHCLVDMRFKGVRVDVEQSSCK